MSNRILYTILFGVSADRDDENARYEVEELTKMYFPGFALFQGKGLWQEAKETAFQLLISTDDDAAIHRLLEQIKVRFRQNSVMVIRHDSATVKFD